MSHTSGVHMANAYDPNTAAGVDSATREAIARRERVLGPSYRLFYRTPVALDSASGVWMHGPRGERYLDAYNNVPAIGHSHPEVAEAVAAQLGTLNTHTRYLTDAVVEYSERLLEKFPAELDRVTYTCSGSEAVDLALRIARAHTGEHGVIVTRNAYHGTTAAAAAISPSLGVNNEIPDDVALAEFYGSPELTPEERAEAFAASVAEAIAELRRRGFGVAALIVDSVLSSDGVHPEPAGFLRPALELVHEAGGLYIADEVQPGFGRLGTWWGFERHGIVPDLAVLGKPMGNGLPIAAVVGSHAVQERFGSRVRYFNTFAGNPVSIAAAGAVLTVIERDGLLAHAARVGAELAEGFRALARDRDEILQVRGAGLFLGVDLASAELASATVNGMRERGVLISASGPNEATLKIRPPLPFASEHAQLLLSVAAEALQAA